MGSSTKVARRMDARIVELAGYMPRWLRAFDGAERFSGPSLYFHRRTLDCLHRHTSVAEALDSDEFFDWLYATLTAWGMHRMGGGNTRLRELHEIKASVRSQTESIGRLQHLRLATITDTDFRDVVKAIWQVLQALTVSVADAKIVANSKVLHHILPELVPPIDRTYTYNFFYNRTMLSISEQAAFEEILTGLHRVARAQRQLVQSAVRGGWYSSETKVIDNAVIGYVVEVLRVKGETSS